jgi:hypothetical protein
LFGVLGASKEAIVIDWSIGDLKQWVK